MLFILVLAVVAIVMFGLGVMLGPAIHKMVETTALDEILSRGEVAPPVSNKFDPLISVGDSWTPPKKPAKRQSKGKRKGK